MFLYLFFNWCSYNVCSCCFYVLVLRYSGGCLLCMLHFLHVQFPSFFVQIVSEFVKMLCLKYLILFSRHTFPQNHACLKAIQLPRIQRTIKHTHAAMGDVFCKFNQPFDLLTHTFAHCFVNFSFMITQPLNIKSWLDCWSKSNSITLNYNP